MRTYRVNVTVYTDTDGRDYAGTYYVRRQADALDRLMTDHGLSIRDVAAIHYRSAFQRQHDALRYPERPQ